MIKKIITVLLCLCFLTTGFSTFADEEISVKIEFEEQRVEIGNNIALKISVTGNVTSVKANIAYNNFFLNYNGAGLGFDINTGEYTITFTPSNEPYILYCSANNSGEAQLTLKNVTCQTDGGTKNIGDLTANVTITPNYTKIYTKEDLSNIRNDLSGAYLLMNDIKFTEKDFAENGAFYNDGFGWIPIGAVVKEAFTGEFNGNGYTISGLTINKAYYNYCGLFGVNRGTIVSLRLKDTYIDGRIGLNMNQASAPAPTVKGKVDYEDKDVWTEPDDSITEESLKNYDRTGSSTANIGLICGFNLGSVKNSYASGEIYGNSGAGGIAGRSNGMISLCAANVIINEAAVSGGIAGITSAYSVINDCAVEGEISGATAGGIIGNGMGKVNRVYSLCMGEDLKAGFGKVSNMTVTEIYAFGDCVADDLTKIKDISELSALRFSSGEWSYGEYPYPTPLADLLKKTVIGDVNGDGEINTVDLAALKLFLAGLGEIDETAGDMNGDEKVDTVDLATMKLVLAGLETE